MNASSDLNCEESGGLPRYLPIILVWLLIFMAYSYIAVTNPNRRAFIAPDESNTFHVAERLAEQGTFYIESPLNERFGTNIFRGRHYAEVEENKYTAYNSIGLTLLIALGMKARITYFVIPFFSSLGVIGIYLIVKNVFDRRAAWLAALIFGLLPSNIYHSNLLFDANPAFAMMLLSLGLLLWCFKRNSQILSVLAGFTLGMAFLIRQSLAAYVIIIFVFALLNIRRLKLRYWITYVVGSAIPALFIMGVNKVVYGSFTSSGATVKSGATVEALFPGFDAAAIAHSMHTYIVIYVPLLLVMGIAGAIFFFKWRKGKVERTFLLLMLAMFVVTLLMFGSRSRTYGFRSLLISGSISRYYLPIYAFLAIFASCFLVYLAMRGKRVAFVLVVSSIIISFSILTFGSIAGINGMQSMRTHFNEMDKIIESVRGFGEKTVIFTKTVDKYFYPDVYVGLCYTQADIDKNPNLMRRYPIVDPAEDILPIIDSLKSEGWRVLIAYDAVEVLDILAQGGYIWMTLDGVWGGLREVLVNPDGDI